MSDPNLSLDQWTLEALRCPDLPAALTLLHERTQSHPAVDLSGREAILRHHFETLDRTNHLDPLTGLLRREAFLRRAAPLVALAQRHTLPLALVLADIDHLKHLNDTHGHRAGDALLTQFGRCILDTLRNSDLAGRYGGDEFILLLPHTDDAGAQRLISRLTAAMARLTPSCTAQTGMVLLGDEAPDLSALVDRADAALLQAKRTRS